MNHFLSENAGNHVSGAFSSHLLAYDKRHKRTVPHTPQQNGVLEGLNPTVLNLVRSVLLNRSTPKQFWASALDTAIYAQNRVASHSIAPHTTPYHVSLMPIPNLCHLRTFQAVCW